MSDYYYYNGVIYNTDELNHFKYIKKKKVNGKWRYYYDIKDALGYDEREHYEKSKSAVMTRAARYGAAKGNLKAMNDGMLRYKVVNDRSVPADKYTKRYDQALNRYSYAEQRLSESRKAYLKTPMGKIQITKEKIEDIKSRLGEKAAKISKENAKKKVEKAKRKKALKRSRERYKNEQKTLKKLYKEPKKKSKNATKISTYSHLGYYG